MKRSPVLAAVLGLLNLGVSSATQSMLSQISGPASEQALPPQSQTPANPDSAVPPAQPDPTTNHQSARAFEGKIERSGDQFVLMENTSQTSYQLDDQDKAKHFEGKDVRIMATIDAESNRLHVVDIIRADTQ